MHIWKAFVLTQKNRLPARCCKWLDEIELVHYDARRIELKAPSAFLAAWFDEHLRSSLEKFAQSTSSRRIKIEITLPNELVKLPPKPLIEQAPLNPLFTFQNFAFWDNNSLWKGALSHLDHYNPLYFFGPKGSGKTHLMQAFAHKFQQEKKRVLFISAKSFQEAFIYAIRSNQVSTFRAHFTNLEALLIDDIDHLAGKPATLEAFFHVFNSLHEQKAQLFFSSNKAPHHIEGLESRIVSRLQWGLCLKLESPAEKGLTALLEKKALALGVDLVSASHILKLIMGRSKKPHECVRALEGFILNEHLEGKSFHTLSSNALSERLQCLMHAQKSLTPEVLIQAVSHFYKIPTEDLLGKSKAHAFSRPRKIAMYLCKKELKLSYPAIGKIFARDHSTVINAVRSCENSQLVDAHTLDKLLQSASKEIASFSSLEKASSKKPV